MTKVGSMAKGLNRDRSFAAGAIRAFLKMGVCPAGYDRGDLDSFAARLDEQELADETQESTDVERWRVLYRALAWMENDYIGVNGLSTDFTQKHKALGYAHEGYHNAQRVLDEHKPPVPEGMQQGIRCQCWATEKGPPHTHYDEPPYRCARGCGCKAYEPAAPPRANGDRMT